MKIFSHKNHSNSLHGARRFAERFANIGHDPHIDWVLILVISAIASILLVIAGAFSYIKVGELLSSPSPITPAPAARFNVKMLDDVIGQFDARASERADLIKAYKGLADPSI